ncbi:hypothetical protein E2P81_ATG10549 [Venturia nashicola]|nr:hypothetical protein E2P81_ATG10549 [Venturia nashicola]
MSQHLVVALMEQAGLFTRTQVRKRAEVGLRLNPSVVIAKYDGEERARSAEMNGGDGWWRKLVSITTYALSETTGQDPDTCITCYGVIEDRCGEVEKEQQEVSARGVNAKSSTMVECCRRHV